MLKHILNTLITKIIVGILNLSIAILISNYLGAEGKGIQGIILTTISIIIIFTGIVGSGALNYLLPRVGFSVLIIPSYLWSLFITIITFISLYVLDVVDNQYVPHVVMLCLVLSVTGINNAILHAGKKIVQVNIVALVQVTFTMLLILLQFVLLNDAGIEAYIYSLYAGYGAALILSFVYSYPEYKLASYRGKKARFFAGAKSLLKYGGYNQLDILAQVLSFRMGYYFLNSMVDLSSVGIYSNAISLVESVWIISRSIAFVQQSRIVNSRDQAYIVEITLKFIKLSGSLAFLAIVVFVFIPVSFYLYLFGDEFGLMRYAILSISPGILFFSISFILSAYYSGTGKHKVNTYASILGLVVLIFASFIFIPSYNIIGAGVAASLSYLATTVYKMIYFVKLGRISTSKLMPGKNDLISFVEVFKRKG